MKEKDEIMKEYILFVTEEMIMDERYKDWKAGRIEVRDKESIYALSEHRFFVPKEIFECSILPLDGKKINAPLKINIDIE